MPKTKTELRLKINSQVNNERIIWGSFLNELFSDFIESFSFKNIVTSTSERNAIRDKEAGMLVYVKGDTLYVLENDLVTWTPFVKDSYTKTQVVNLLSSKVDKVIGKGLSTNDFTLELLNKLNQIDEGATRINLLTEVPGYNLSKKKTVLYDRNTPVLSVDNHTILIDATYRNIDVHLPDASLIETAGLIFVLKRIDETANTVTIKPFDIDYSASTSNPLNNQKIEFSVSLALTTRDAVMIQCVEGNWYIIN